MELLYLIVGAAVGYLARWAQIRWLEEPSERRRERRAEIREALTSAAALLRPTIEELRTLRGGVAIEADPNRSRNDWWKPVGDVLHDYRQRFEHEWRTEFDFIHVVQIGTAKMMGAETAIFESLIQQHPAHVITQRIGALTEAVEELHKALVDSAARSRFNLART